VRREPVRDQEWYHQNAAHSLFIGLEKILNGPDETIYRSSSFRSLWQWACVHSTFRASGFDFAGNGSNLTDSKVRKNEQNDTDVLEARRAWLLLLFLVLTKLIKAFYNPDPYYEPSPQFVIQSDSDTRLFYENKGILVDCVRTLRPVLSLPIGR
jgi:hypothetical protein